MPDPALMNGTALTPPPPGNPGPAPGPAPGITQPGAEPSDSDDQQATPEEQKQYDQFVSMARNLLYDKKNPKTTELMLTALKQGDPVKALAHVAVSVVMRVQAAAQQAGEQIDPAVLLHGGQEIISDIADFSNQVSKKQGTPTYDDKQIQGAYLMAVDLYRQMQGQNGMNQQTAKQELGQAADADRQGDIESVIPGATQAAKVLAPAAQAVTPGGDNETQGDDDGDEPPPPKKPAKPAKGGKPPKKAGRK